MGKRGRLEECKETGSRIWEEDKYKSKTIREVGYNRRKRL